MPSKMVTDREKAAVAVEGAALTLAGDAAQGASRLFSPFVGEGETLPDFHFVQALHERLLRWQRRQVVLADTAHTHALLAENAALRARDAAALRLYDTIITVRQTLENQYGAGGAEKLLALEPGILARDPQRLQRFARDAIALMTAPEFALPPTQIGEDLTVEHLLAKLRPPLEALDEALAAVEPKKRESQRTRKAKSETLETLDESIVLSARWLEANLGRAGEHYHAERVRRSTHRRKPKAPSDSELDAVEKGEGEEKAATESAEGSAAASTAPTPAPQPATAQPFTAQPVATLQLVAAPHPMAVPPPVPAPQPAPVAPQPAADAAKPASSAAKPAAQGEKPAAKKEENRARR